MNNWVPRSKYEVAPGLFIGSEIGDIDREVKVLMKEYLNGNQESLKKIRRLQDRRIELLKPKMMRKSNETS